MRNDDSTYVDYADLSGSVYGRITVVRFSHEPKPYRRFWVCRCACGTERTLREDYIKSKSASVTCTLCRRLEIAARTGPRRCPGCDTMRPRSEFHRDSTTTDGLQRYCTSCSRSKAAKYRIRLARRRPEEFVIPAQKRCVCCGVTQVAAEFWTDRTQLDGLAKDCSTCANARTRDWYERVGRAKRQPRVRLARYKMTPDDLAALLLHQGHTCAICRRPLDAPRSFHIDHDHSTGIVRGLLCPTCNNGLGAFRDSPERLNAAIAYLAAPPNTVRHLL
jgi:hypothetical protein